MIDKITITAILVALLSLISIEARADNPHNPVEGLGISPDFANDQTFFLATYDELTVGYIDILRSTDGGTTWTKLPNGMDNIFKVTAIRVSPNFKIDRAVFVATFGNGIYQSSNQGNSWQPFNTGLINLQAKNLVIAGTDPDYVLFLSLNNGTFYRRSSTETAWNRILDPSFAVTVIAASPDFTQDGTVIAADTSGNLRISSDGGVNWTDLGNPAGATVYDIAITPGTPKEIYLATSAGVFHSTDLGHTFTNKSGNLPAEAINNVAVSPDYATDRTVFSTSVTQAIFKSTDGGENWIFHSSGAKITNQAPPLEEFKEIQVSNSLSGSQTVFLSAANGLFISPDGGDTWTKKLPRKGLVTGLAISPHFRDDQTVMATSYDSDGFYTSSDRGVTWAPVTAGWEIPPFTQILSAFDIDFVQNRMGSPIAVAATNFSQVGFTSDFGNNWNVLLIPKFTDIAPGEVFVNRLALSPNFDADQEIYFATRSHGIIQTTDSGVSWRTMRGVPKSPSITGVVVSPNYAVDRTAFAANFGGEVWRTTDGGDSWSRTGSDTIVSRGYNTTGYTGVAISPHFATDRLVLAGTNNGVYRSINGGSTWKQLKNVKIGPGTVIQQIEFSPNFVNDRIAFINVRGKGFYRVFLDEKGIVTSVQQAGLSSLLKKNIQFIEFRISPNFAQDGTLFGASRERVYISTNGGSSWSVAGQP